MGMVRWFQPNTSTPAAYYQHSKNKKINILILKVNKHIQTFKSTVGIVCHVVMWMKCSCFIHAVLFPSLKKIRFNFYYYFRNQYNNGYLSDVMWLQKVWHVKTADDGAGLPEWWHHINVQFRLPNPLEGVLVRGRLCFLQYIDQLSTEQAHI